jgi:hypothetical protein
MVDVFISYKSEDREGANKINTLLRSAGYSTWWDSSLQAGQQYNDEIDKNLREAKAAVVIWSKRGWGSKWVKEEALFARDRDKLLPVRIDDVEIGVPFYSLQTLDFQGWDGNSTSRAATVLIDSLEQYAPKKLRPNYAINVYWARFNDRYISEDLSDESYAIRFLERVVAFCSTIGVDLHLINAWDHIVNPHMIEDRSIYERDLNILVFFGCIKLDGFAEDVFCPGLRRLARELNPYVLHVGHDDFSLDYLNFYCSPDRKVETRTAKLPDPDTLLGDSAVEALSAYISFRALKVREAMNKQQTTTA